jgi:hypothetical protein
VRQRNDTGSAWTFMGDPPVRVLPGETAEHPVLLDGWTAVDNEPEAKTDEVAPKTPSRKRAAAADTDTKDGGEPQ